MIRAAALLALVAGCAGAPKPVHYYDLVGPTSAAPPAAANGLPIIAIEPFSAASAYDSDDIAIRRSDVQLDYYRYHRWVAPAPDQVTELIARGLQESGRFGRVDVDEVDPKVGLVVHGRVLALEARADGDTVAAHVVLELTGTSESGAVVFRRQLERDVPARTKTVGSLVAAFHAAIAAIAGTAAPLLAAAAKPPAPAGGR